MNSQGLASFLPSFIRSAMNSDSDENLVWGNETLEPILFKIKRLQEWVMGQRSYLVSGQFSFLFFIFIFLFYLVPDNLISYNSVANHTAMTFEKLSKNNYILN